MPSRGAVTFDQVPAPAWADNQSRPSAANMRYQHSAPGLDASSLALGERSLSSRSHAAETSSMRPSGLPSSSPMAGGRQRMQPTPIDLDGLPSWPSRATKLGDLFEDDDAQSLSSDGLGMRVASPTGPASTPAPKNNLLSKLKKKKDGDAGRGLLSRIKNKARQSTAGDPSLPPDPFGANRRDHTTHDRPGSVLNGSRHALSSSSSASRPTPRNPWENLSDLFSDVTIPLRAGCPAEHAPGRWSDFVHLYRHGAIDVSDPPALPLQAPDILEATWVVDMPPELQELARTTAAQRLLEPSSSSSLASSSASQLRIVSPGLSSGAGSIASDLNAGTAGPSSSVMNLTPILQSFPSAPRWGNVHIDSSQSSNLRDRRRPSAAPSHASSTALEPARCSSEWGADEVLDAEGVAGDADAAPALLMLKDGMGAPTPPFEAARLLALYRCRYERFLPGGDDPLSPPLPSALGALSGVAGHALSPSIGSPASTSSSRQRLNNVSFAGNLSNYTRGASSALSSSSRGKDSATSGAVSSIAAAAATGARGLEDEVGARDTVANLSLTFNDAVIKAVTSALDAFVKAADAEHEHVARFCFVGKDAVVPIATARQAKRKTSVLEGAEGIERLQSLEAHVILNRGEPVVLLDARIDPRFADLSTKTSDPAWPATVAFFVSTPIRSPDGYPVATLSFASSAPRMPSQWSTGEMRKLKPLAHNIEAALESALESDAELKAKVLQRTFNSLQRLLATTATPASTLVDSLRKVSGAMVSSTSAAGPQQTFASSLLDEVQQTTQAEEETLKQDEERATYQQKLDSIEAALRIICTELDFDAAYIAELSSPGSQTELLASFGLDTAALEGDVELEARAHIDAALDVRPRVFQNVSVGAHKGKHIGRPALPWWHQVQSTSSSYHRDESELLPVFVSGVLAACSRAVPDVGERTQHVLVVLSRDETKVIEAVDVAFFERVSALISQALPSSTLRRISEQMATREAREHVESWARTASTLARPPSNRNKSSRSAISYDSHDGVSIPPRSTSSHGPSLRQQNSAQLLGRFTGQDVEPRPTLPGSQRHRTISSSGNSSRPSTAPGLGRPAEHAGRPRTATNVSLMSAGSGASDALRTPASFISDQDSGVAWSSSSLAGRSPPSISTDSGSSSRRAKLREPATPPPEVPALPALPTGSVTSRASPHGKGSVAHQNKGQAMPLDTDDEDDVRDSRRPYTDDDFVILSASGPALTGPLLLSDDGHRQRRHTDFIDASSAPAFIDPFAAARSQGPLRTLSHKPSTTTIMAPRRDSSLKAASRSAARRAADLAESKAIAAAANAA